jgi:hypothetical protein
MSVSAESFLMCIEVWRMRFGPLSIWIMELAERGPEAQKHKVIAVLLRETRPCVLAGDSLGR